MPTKEEKITTPEEEVVPKENNKDLLKKAKDFMFALCDYTITQTDHGRTRLRIINGEACGNGFKLEPAQYKNGNRDFILHEYVGNKSTALMAGRDLDVFYDLFINKIF